MNVEASTLPDDSTLLKQMLVDFQEYYDKETGILLEQIRHLRAQLFGRKSEKFQSEGGPQPLPLFDMPEPVGIEDDKEEIHVPARVQVIRHIRPKYACKNCEGVEDNGPTVKIAPVHPQIIPKSIASPGLLAHILTGKFIDHTPFYRQEKQFIRLGVEVSRTSMCNWAVPDCISLPTTVEFASG